MRKTSSARVVWTLAAAATVLCVLPLVHAGHIIVLQRPPGPRPTPTPTVLAKQKPLWLPGVLEMEDFSTTGEGVAYHDLDAANTGGAYRPAEGVDIEESVGGGYDVTSVKAGEWLSYGILLPQGSYRLQVRVASSGAGGTFHVEIGGVDVTGPITIPSTGGWQSWYTISRVMNVSCLAYRIRVVMDTNGGAGVVGNFNYLSIAEATIPPSPTPPPPNFCSASAWQASVAYATNARANRNGIDYVASAPSQGVDPETHNGAGQPWTEQLRCGPHAESVTNTYVWIPGTLEVESFAPIHEDTGYFDVDSANLGGAYRTSEGVDVETTTDVGGGYDVGWTRQGEWLEYPWVRVAWNGDYVARVRVASAGPGGRFHVEVGGVDVTGSMTVPDTGGAQSWQTISAPVSLTHGKWKLRLVMDADGPGGTVGRFNHVSFDPGPAPPTPTPTPTMTPEPSATATPGTPTPTPTRCELVTAWHYGITFQAGQLVSDRGQLFRCRQTHISQQGFDPINHPALWGPPDTVVTPPTPTPVPTPWPWQPWTTYNVGQLVTYGGHTYSCRQQHQSQPGWEPPNVESLWTLVV
jgi:hypothetical protein